MAIRSIAQTDDEIKSEHLEQTIDLMKGKKPDAAHHSLRERPSVGGCLGITRASFNRFVQRHHAEKKG